MKYDTKYDIRVENNYVGRWYVAQNYFDALELFNMLSKVAPVVEMWCGTRLISAYGNKY
jgi:hypothetical protein